jgi:hypothetical protein
VSDTAEESDEFNVDDNCKSVSGNDESKLFTVDDSVLCLRE